MPKRPLDTDVLTAARLRISAMFETFKKLYVSFSGGKDSTVMMHLVMQEARLRNREVGVLIVDLEGQYRRTINHIDALLAAYKEYAKPFWICLPLSLRNAVSVYEPKWICWDKDRRADWIREYPDECINDELFFPFFWKGMEFEEFVPLFGEWYAQGERTGCFVGIRADESLNRFRTIASTDKETIDGHQWTTRITDNVFNVYPIYDWKTEDIWTFHAKHKECDYNTLYDVMHQAGLSIHQQRICQPYGDDQRRGLWLFHLIEPDTWARVLARVEGANGGALYIQERGNITGYNRISKPPGHTWKSFAMFLLDTMPPRTAEHYRNKLAVHFQWYSRKGYDPANIPDQQAQEIESKRKGPSWRRVCKALLRNDYYFKGMGFSPTKSTAYQRYCDLMKRRRDKWNIFPTSKEDQ